MKRLLLFVLMLSCYFTGNTQGQDITDDPHKTEIEAMMKGVYGYDVRSGGYEGNKAYYSKNGYNYSYRYSDKKVYTAAALCLVAVFLLAKWGDKVMARRKNADALHEQV